MSTVLEQDHFYSAFLVSHVTVQTNFQNHDEEALCLSAREGTFDVASPFHNVDDLRDGCKAEGLKMKKRHWNRFLIACRYQHLPHTKFVPSRPFGFDQV